MFRAKFSQIVEAVAESGHIPQSNAVREADALAKVRDPAPPRRAEDCPPYRICRVLQLPRVDFEGLDSCGMERTHECARTGHGGLSRQYESKIIMTHECARTGHGGLSRQYESKIIMTHECARTGRGGLSRQHESKIIMTHECVPHGGAHSCNLRHSDIDTPSSPLPACFCNRPCKWTDEHGSCSRLKLAGHFAIINANVLSSILS